MFDATCPKCGAPPEVAQLEIVSGRFTASKMYLQPDGFATTDAKNFSTDEEKVFCHRCRKTFDLGECLVKE